MRKTSTRLSSEERRAAIVRAVRTVFADKGFHGTTTRELAEAAGVSEALLFKHFPSKEALYTAMHSSCCQQASGEGKALMGLEPSTSSLVLLVHFLVARLGLGRTPHGGPEDGTMHRLVLRSLMEDGEFARLFLARVTATWVPKVEECLKAAAAAGDVIDTPVLPSLRALFAQHLAAMLMVHRLPPSPAVNYRVPADRLLEQAVWFILGGMGLRPEAVRRHYNPKALSLLGA